VTDTATHHRDSVKAAIAMMASDLSAPLDLDAMAYVAGLSKFYFCRVFKAITGTSPGRKLSSLRLYEACRLLRTTDLPIQVIAPRVGYDAAKFATAFRQRFGCTPTEYRRRGKDGAS
jgi:AraC family transcriptional regulator